MLDKCNHNDTIFIGGFNRVQKLKLNNETVLTETQFVRLLLPYLYERGINKINEDELPKKLFPYYLDEKYKILFKNVVKSRDGNEVNIKEGLFNVKYFSGNIMFNPNNSKILHLVYEPNYDMSEDEAKLDPEIIELLKKIADEFGIRNKVETPELKIYGYDPNKSYSLIEGKNSNILHRLELITDGNIKTISDSQMEPHVFYPNPSDDSYSIYQEGIYRDVEIENASYAITQGIYNGKIKSLKVFTKLLELEKLEKIKGIANVIHDDEESLLVKDRPYVRRKTL